MSKRLTKEDILRSRIDIEYFYVEELEGEIPLRPLSESQWNQVQTVAMTGMKAQGNNNQDMSFEFDISEVQVQAFKANCLAVSYGMADGSHWTSGDIEKAQWLPGTVEKIANRIFKITGVDLTPGEVHSFRNVSRRARNGNLTPLRGTVSASPERTDGTTSRVPADSFTEGSGNIIPEEDGLSIP